MAGGPHDHDADEAGGPFAALVDYFDGPSTSFPDLDYLDILAGLTVLVIGVAIWGYSVLS